MKNNKFTTPLTATIEILNSTAVGIKENQNIDTNIIDIELLTKFYDQIVKTIVQGITEGGLKYEKEVIKRIFMDGIKIGQSNSNMNDAIAEQVANLYYENEFETLLKEDNE